MPPKMDEDDLQHVGLLVPVKLKKKIDDWRRKQPGLPNRSTAIRALIEFSLEQQDKRRAAAV
jgi:metal-responsive CopG/Arc/MetJ family transcriptional regulator